MIESVLGVATLEPIEFWMWHLNNWHKVRTNPS
jgi:hypothetical protein